MKGSFRPSNAISNTDEMNQEDQLNILDTCIDRISDMDGHVVRFAQSPWDTDNLKRLAEHFSVLAEISKTKEQMRLSEIYDMACSGQNLCTTIITHQPDDVIVYWRSFKEMLSHIRTCVEKEKERIMTMPDERRPRNSQQAYDPSQDFGSYGGSGSQGAPGAFRASGASGAYGSSGASDSYGSYDGSPPSSNSSQPSRSASLPPSSNMPPSSSHSSLRAQQPPSNQNQYQPNSAPVSAPLSAPMSAIPTQINPHNVAPNAVNSTPASQIQQNNYLAAQTPYPFATPTPAQTQAPQPEPAPPIVPTHDVVVVSSNMEKLRALSTALSHQAISVRPCSDLNQAWETTLNHMPNGLLVCVPVQAGNAYQFISQVRALPGAENIAIIVLGEEHAFLESINTVKARADAFLALPVEVDAILEKFKYFFGRGKPQLYRILCMEQDPLEAQSVVETLEHAGYNVLWQSDPFAFEESLLAFSPDLILLDAASSQIDGFELSRYLRQSERFATVPVLFLTGENNLEAHMEGARSLADDYLVKPVIPELLVATVSGKLERFRIFKKLLKNDPLTQILNYDHFVDLAQRSLKARANLPGASRAILTVIDIDNLKSLNNTFGFAVGDRTLLALVQVIRKVFRHTDLIGRVGGDRIAILDYGLPLRETMETVDDLLLNFAQVPHKSKGNIFKVTASAGISAAMEQERFADLLERSLRAVQNAKSQGKGRICQG
ncbi:MAG: diguanylate cyclase [Candidatus Melainabacteria bacterium]|nr:MAG: diguanylate cyclase [Candidatus Melainabacteria bacterium]